MAIMIIDYDEFYRLRVDVYTINADLFQLVLEQISINKDPSGKAFTENTQEYFFNQQQLKQFVEHINEATRDHI